MGFIFQIRQKKNCKKKHPCIRKFYRSNVHKFHFGDVTGKFAYIFGKVDNPSIVRRSVSLCEYVPN